LFPVGTLRLLLSDVTNEVVREPVGHLCKALGMVKHVARKCQLAGESILHLRDVHILGAPIVEEAVRDGSVEETLVSCAGDVPKAGNVGIGKTFMLEKSNLVARW
jgi:hypothetical protein